MSKTLAQQYQQEFTDAVSPHQFGLAIRSGIDAAVHLVRTKTDADPTLTLTQIDGVGAFDHIHRATMLQGVFNLLSSSVFCSDEYEDPIPVKEFQKNLNRLIKLASTTEQYWSNLLSPRFELYNHLVRDFREVDFQSLLQF